MGKISAKRSSVHSTLSWNKFFCAGKIEYKLDINQEKWEFNRKVRSPQMIHFNIRNWISSNFSSWRLQSRLINYVFYYFALCWFVVIDMGVLLDQIE